MRERLIVLAMIASVALFAVPAGATSLSLYGQEGITGKDGTIAINAAGANGDADADWTNWKWQTGSASMFGVYGSEGWLGSIPPIDPKLLIEADIEMYCYQTCSKYEIYFHLGNISTATAAHKTAYVDGTFSSNNGQWIGFVIGAGKTIEGSEGAYTGRITDGMQGTVNVLGTPIPTEKFPVVITMDTVGVQGYRPFDSFGAGASGTIKDAIWWKVNNGLPGSYTLQWKIEIEPALNQADGDYGFDPLFVTAPIL